MPEPVVIPPRSWRASKRSSGLTNMLDRPVVAELADPFGFPEGGN